MTKLLIRLSIGFLLSCSDTKWRLNKHDQCKVDVKMVEYKSRGDDYVMKIPKNWKAFKQATGPSNVVFEVDAQWEEEYDTMNRVLFSVYKHDVSKNYSNPKREFELSVAYLLKDYPTVKKIDSGETNILGDQAFYLQTFDEKASKQNYTDLYFQLRNHIDSNFYILQLHAPHTNELNENMCVLLEMAKSFEFVRKDD